MKMFLFFLMIFTSTQCFALANFGDEVVQCLGSKKVQPTDQDFAKQSEICEQKVTLDRAANHSVVVSPDDNKTKINNSNTGTSNPTISADLLYQKCSATKDDERAICILTIKAFMDGFIEGVAKGAIDVYRFDTQVYSLVKDLKAAEAKPRINRVVNMSTCIQKVSVADMANSFVEFVSARPEFRPGSYRKAMTTAIISKYCS